MTIHTRAEPHPDFLEAHYTSHWQGRRLIALWVLLCQGVQSCGVGMPCWRIMPSGIAVSLTRQPDGRRTLRIAQSTPIPEERWNLVLADMLAQFREPLLWEREDELGAPGMATRFHEPLTLL